MVTLWEFDSPRPHSKFPNSLPPLRESVGFGSKVVGVAVVLGHLLRHLPRDGARDDGPGNLTA